MKRMTIAPVRVGGRRYHIERKCGQLHNTLLLITIRALIWICNVSVQNLKARFGIQDSTYLCRWRYCSHWVIPRRPLLYHCHCHCRHPLSRHHCWQLMLLSHKRNLQGVLVRRRLEYPEVLTRLVNKKLCNVKVIQIISASNLCTNFVACSNFA